MDNKQQGNRCKFQETWPTPAEAMALQSKKSSTKQSSKECTLIQRLEKTSEQSSEISFLQPSVINNPPQTQKVEEEKIDIPVPNPNIHVWSEKLTEESDVSKQIHPSLLSQFKPSKTHRDGNCLYEAVCLCVGMAPSGQQVLQDKTAHCIKQHANHFEGLLKASACDDISLDRLIQQCYQPSTKEGWGNEFHILALAIMLKRNIFVYTVFQGANGQFFQRKNKNIIGLAEEFSRGGDKVEQHMNYEPQKGISCHYPICLHLDRDHFTALVPRLSNPIYCIPQATNLPSIPDNGIVPTSPETSKPTKRMTRKARWLASKTPAELAEHKAREKAKRQAREADPQVLEKRQKAERERYAANPEDKKTAERERYAADKEQQKRAKRERYAADQEQQKKAKRERYAADQEQQKRAKRERYAADQERQRFWQRERYSADQEQQKKAKRERYAADQELQKKAKRERYAADQEQQKKAKRERYAADAENRKKEERERYTADQENKRKSQRERYAADQGSKRESQRERYAADPEEKRKAQRERYAADQEAKIKAQRERYAGDKEEKRKAQRERYAADSEDQLKRKKTSQEIYAKNKAAEKNFDYQLKKAREFVSQLPILACTVCHRVRYRDQVVQCKREKYPMENPIILQCLTGEFIHQCQENCELQNNDNHALLQQEWICHTCHSSLKKNKMPVQAVINGLDVGQVPDELKTLNPLERHLIALVQAFIKIIPLPKGGQMGIRGQLVCVPANLQLTADSLPWTPDVNHLIRHSGLGS